jgi:hypothetical protein
MNNIALSFLLMFIIVISSYLIGSFFDVGLQYYMPFLLWFLALCIFNMFLDKQHVNIYMKKIELSKDSSIKKDSIATRAMKAVRAAIPTRLTKTYQSNPTNINPTNINPTNVNPTNVNTIT